MKRRWDWSQRMWATLQQARDRPFAYGEHDCVHLVAAVLDAMTDSYWMAELADLYRSSGGVKFVVRTPGALDAIVTARLGNPLPATMARRGDVVGLRLDTGSAIGVCVGASIAVASDGVKYLPLDRAHCAWRVG